MLNGNLWKWNNEKGYTAFQIGQINSKNKIIYIGGLSDGFYCCQYLYNINQLITSSLSSLSSPLFSSSISSNISNISSNITSNTSNIDNNLKEDSWSLIQVLLGSSYSGYGICTLDNDIQELSEFIIHLKNEYNCQKVILIGHSTGCQISIHFTNYGLQEAVSLLYGVILQAPVSDQEAGTLISSTQYYLEWAKNQSSDKLDTLMPIEAHYNPITIRRFLSLFDRNGLDDYFSSYFTVSELKEKFFGLKTRNIPIYKVIIAYSMKDEYVPETVNKDELIDKLVEAIGSSIAIPLKLMNSNHNLSEPKDGSDLQLFLTQLQTLLNEVNQL